jgi:hypothetical protein
LQSVATIVAKGDLNFASRATGPLRIEFIDMDREELNSWSSALALPSRKKIIAR